MGFLEFSERILMPLLAALVGAVIGAIMAFKYQRKMEVQRDKRGLMQMLMAYRSVGAVEIDWIKALNMIDIVFHDSQEIKALLRRYMYYTDSTRYQTNEHQQILVDLLYAMGQSCGYKQLTEVDIRDAYNPISLNHIYATTLSKFSEMGNSSEPPPSTKL
jgi:hypothetical protein